MMNGHCGTFVFTSVIPYFLLSYLSARLYLVALFTLSRSHA